MPVFFHDGEAWLKKCKEGNIELPHGSFDGAGISEWISMFILNKITKTVYIARHSHDSFIVVPDNKRANNGSRKRTFTLLKDFNFEISVERNINIVQYLNTEFDLLFGFPI